MNWFHAPGWTTISNNNDVQIHPSLERCLMACLVATEFICLSVDYAPVSDECFLSNMTRFSIPANYVPYALESYTEWIQSDNCSMYIGIIIIFFVDESNVIVSINKPAHVHEYLYIKIRFFVFQG